MQQRAEDSPGKHKHDGRSKGAGIPAGTRRPLRNRIEQSLHVHCLLKEMPVTMCANTTQVPRGCEICPNAGLLVPPECARERGSEVDRTLCL